MTKKNAKHPKVRIKEAAIGLFSEKGYSATTMRQIARRAGLASGSLYNHLKRKSDLLLDIHRDFIHEIIEKTSFHHGVEESCEEKLKQVFRTFMKAIFENKLSFKVLLEQEAFLPTTAKKEVVRNIHLLRHGIEKIIEKGIEQGEIRPIDAKMATFCVFALCNYSLRWIDPNGPYSYEQLGDMFFDFFFKGIANGPPRT